MSVPRETGIIVYGATGYTGRLVCEYRNAQYGVNGHVDWAMGGRSKHRLIAVRHFPFKKKGQVHVNN